MSSSGYHNPNSALFSKMEELKEKNDIEETEDIEDIDVFSEESIQLDLDGDRAEDKAHIFQPFRDIENIKDIIEDKPGNRLLQAYLLGMSKAHKFTSDKSDDSGELSGYLEETDSSMDDSLKNLLNIFNSELIYVCPECHETYKAYEVEDSRKYGDKSDSCDCDDSCDCGGDCGDDCSCEDKTNSATNIKECPECGTRLYLNVDKDKFEGIVYGSGRKGKYFDIEWELKHILKWFGCARNQLFIKSECPDCGHEHTKKTKCGSIFCSDCHDESITDHKESMISYGGDFLHTKFTLKPDDNVWDRMGEDIYNRCKECGETLGFGFNECPNCGSHDIETCKSWDRFTCIDCGAEYDYKKDRCDECKNTCPHCGGSVSKVYECSECGDRKLYVDAECPTLGCDPSENHDVYPGEECPVCGETLQISDCECGGEIKERFECDDCGRFTANKGHVKRNINILKKAGWHAVKTAFKKRFNVEVGISGNQHTFGSLDLTWKPHLNIITSLTGLRERCKNCGHEDIRIDSCPNCEWEDREENIETVIRTVKPNGVNPGNQKYVDSKFIDIMRSEFTKYLRDIFDDLPKPKSHLTNNSDESAYEITRSEVEVCPDCYQEISRSDGKIKCDNPGCKNNYLLDEDLESKPLAEELMELIEGNKSDSMDDTLRYFKRAPLTDKNILEVKENKIKFTTDKRRQKNKPPLELDPESFYYRIKQHIPPRNFRDFRTVGIYSTAHRHHYEYPRIRTSVEEKYIKKVVNKTLDILEDYEETLRNKGFDVDPDSLKRIVSDIVDTQYSGYEKVGRDIIAQVINSQGIDNYKNKSPIFKDRTKVISDQIMQYWSDTIGRESSNDLRVLTKRVLELLDEIGEDIDPLDSAKLNYLSNQLLEDIPELFDNNDIDKDPDRYTVNKLKPGVKRIIDDIVKNPDVENKETYALDEYIRIYNLDNKELNNKAIGIKKRLYQKMGAGIWNNTTCPDCGDKLLFKSFNLYGNQVNKSLVFYSIFTIRDNDLNSINFTFYDLLRESNRDILPKNDKDPPDGGGNHV